MRFSLCRSTNSGFGSWLTSPSRREHQGTGLIEDNKIESLPRFGNVDSNRQACSCRVHGRSATLLQGSLGILRS